MSQEGPKLYTHKPKKAQIKAKAAASPTAPTPSPTPKPTPSMSAAEAAAASYKVGGGGPLSPPPPPPPPTPQPPKEPFIRRYKFLWPLLLTVNLGVGAYVFMRMSKKEVTGPKEEASTDAPSTAVSSSPTTASLPAIPVAVAVAPREPIPENEQRKLFKWILEEKRKLKPKNPEEKKRIDEEKAILKQILGSNRLPSI